MPTNREVPAAAKPQETMNITLMVIVAALLLTGVWVLYSLGWLGSWSTAQEVEGTRAGATDANDQDQAPIETPKLSQETAEPVETATQ